MRIAFRRPANPHYLERENERLRKALSELSRDKQILKEALEGPRGLRSPHPAQAYIEPFAPPRLLRAGALQA